MAEPQPHASQITPQHVELARLNSVSQRVAEVVTVFRLLVVCGTVAFCFWIASRGAVALVSNDENRILAVANFVQQFKLGQLWGYIFGAFGVGYGTVQGWGKHRAYQQIHRLREQVEAGEPNRTSSGLTVRGQTPRKGKRR